jgi:hypothetical protein
MQRAAADPRCAAWLGLAVPGATLPGGARVLGLCHELDPVQAAFNLGVMLGWEPTSHERAVREPASAMHAVCIAALLAAGDWHSRRQRVRAARLPTLGELLGALAAHDAAPSAAAATMAVIRLVRAEANANADATDTFAAAAVATELPQPAPATPLLHALDVGQRASHTARIALLCMRQPEFAAHAAAERPVQSVAPGPARRAASLPAELAADATGAALLAAVAAGGIVDDLPIDAFITRLCGT